MVIRIKNIFIFFKLNQKIYKYILPFISLEEDENIETTLTTNQSYHFINEEEY